MTTTELFASAGVVLLIYVVAMHFVFDVAARREDEPTDDDGREP